MNIIDFIKQNAVLGYIGKFFFHVFQALGPRKNIQFDLNYEKYFHTLYRQNTRGVSIYRRLRYRKITKLIAQGGGGSVLDVAFGDGTALLHLQKNLPEATPLLGIEISPSAVANAKAKGLNAREFDLCKFDQNAFKTEFGLDSVDWVIACEILEHISDPEIVLPKLLSIAKKGVLISVPNTGYYPFRIQLILGRFPVQWNVNPGEHLRFWTYSDFKWWLNQLSISGVPYVYFGIPLLRTLWKNIFADGILWRLNPKPEDSR